MQMYTELDIAVTLLVAIHFGLPLIYYYYAKTQWLPLKWNIKKKRNYEPLVTIILPTYNEACIIEKKLENVYLQTYPKNKFELIVIDSGSNDGTIRIAERWLKKRKGIKNVLLIEEINRKGKAQALNKALLYSKGDIVVITDADALWDKHILKNAVEILSDPIVGAISCIKRPIGNNNFNIEKTYRTYYNLLRLAESKAWSTPIFHGEFAAFKKEILDKLKGFPTDIGADDSYTAAMIALLGFRAIIHENIICTESVPRKHYFKWRIRRAQHLLQSFKEINKLRKNITNKIFIRILDMEVFLHLYNPWLLLFSILFLLIDIVKYTSLFSFTTLLLGVVLFLSISSFRTWLYTQLYLLIAFIRNIHTKDIIWTKQPKDL